MNKATNLCQSRRSRKNSTKGSRKFVEKFPNKNWQCQICNSVNDVSQYFCVQCYIDLNYYAYVNNHMFVTHDNSYMQTYYKVAEREDDASDDSRSDDNDSHESEQMALEFVEQLLVDEWTQVSPYFY